MYTEPKAGPNHVLHGLLSFFMCGLGPPVWIIIIAACDDKKRSRMRGCRCGGYLG